MPFLYTKTMPDIEIHALSMYKDYAWQKSHALSPHITLKLGCQVTSTLDCQNEWLKMKQ